MLRSLLLCTTLIAISSPLSAQIQHSESGLGSALIVPYWTIAAGNDSLLSVRNESERPVAVKFRLLGETGQPINAISLYLDARETWVGALSLQVEPVWGFTFLNFDFDRASCALERSALEPNAQTAGVEGNGKLSPPPPPPPLFGAIEIISMGHPETGSDMLASAEEWIDCDELPDRFLMGDWSEDLQAGLTAPTDSLSASVTLVDVPDGGMLTVDAIALRAFSRQPLHRLPIDFGPDLLDGDTRSRVCIADDCATQDWALPAEAVAAALTVSSLRGDFSVETEITGETELILYRPLQAYLGDAGDVEIDGKGWIEMRDRRGRLITQPEPADPLPNELRVELDPARPAFEGFAFGAPGERYLQEYSTPILGHPITVRISSDLIGNPDPGLDTDNDSGVFRLEFDGSDPAASFLTAPDGTRYVGEPILGLVVQQFSNGTLLVDGERVLSNYRSRVPIRFQRQLERSN